MAISHEHRFIFIKINKTGGTAVQHTLETFGVTLEEKGHRVLSD